MHIVQLEVVLDVVVGLVVIVMYVALVVIVLSSYIVLAVGVVYVYRAPLPGNSRMLGTKHIYEFDAASFISPGS